MFVVRIEFAPQVAQGNDSPSSRHEISIVLPECVRIAFARVLAVIEPQPRDSSPDRQPGSSDTINALENKIHRGPLGTHDDSILSFDARILLDKLCELAKRAYQQRTPVHAWRTKSDWFRQAGIDRHRDDADALIAELICAGLIDCRNRGKWKQFRATEIDRCDASQK